MWTISTRVLRPTTLCLVLFTVTAGLFFWETDDWPKAVGYGLFASTIKFPAVWMHGYVWDSIGGRRNLACIPQELKPDQCDAVERQMIFLMLCPMGWLSSPRRLAVRPAAGKELPLVFFLEVLSFPDDSCPCCRAKYNHIRVNGPSKRETHFRPIA